MKITVCESLVRAMLRVLTLGSDANRSSRLAEALEKLGHEIDLWAVSGDGLKTLVDTDKCSGITVSDDLIRMAMLVAARRHEAPLGTALRNALEQLVTELDTWAVDGSSKQRGSNPRVKGSAI